MNKETRDKIIELEKQIKVLKEVDREESLNEWKWLEGKCLHRATTSWEKVTKVTDVDSRTVHFDCIEIYHDMDNGRYSENASYVSLAESGSIGLEDIDSNRVSEEKFMEVFNSAVAHIRSKAENIEWAKV